MSKGNDTENDMIALVFNATALPWDGNANVYISLHTADPGEGGTQNTSETTYTNYVRIAAARTAGGWTVAGSSCSNAALLAFAQAGAGGAQVITHVVIGELSTGAGQIYYSGALNTSLSVSELIQPQFQIGALTVTED